MKLYLGIILFLLFLYLLTFKITYCLISIYLIYCLYVRIFSNKTYLFFSQTPKTQEIVKRSQLSTFSYKANFLFPTPFFQTFGSSFDIRKLSFQESIELKAIQYRVPLAETSLDFIYFPSEDENSEEAADNKKFLMIIPGLTGSIKDSYIRELCSEALNNNFRPIVLNSRWLAKPVKLPKNGPIDFISDVDRTVDYITKTFNIKELYGIGISYGSNMLCKYLGTIGRKTEVFKGAVSIGNPFNMYRNKNLISRFWNLLLCRILQKALLERKKSFRKTKKPCFNFVEVEDALQANNFIVFDEYFTRRMLGYRSTDEYYKKFSCVGDLKNIKVPLLCLQSKDDPISKYEVIPFHESQKNDNLIFLTTERGGHIAWVEGVLRMSVFFPKPCINFLKSL